MEPLHSPSKDAAELVLAQHLAAVSAKASVSTTQAASGFLPKIVSKRVDLGSKTLHCEAHGDYTASGHTLGGGREIWTCCPSCKQDREVAEAERHRAAVAQREAQAREEAIGHAAIPVRFRSRDFDGFVADTPEKQRALSVVRDFAFGFDEYSKKGRGLVLSGLPGTGKSHLAAAAMLHVIKPRLWVQYVTCMALIRAVRETWRRDAEKSERQVLANFGRDIDLLVIDEVGVQYGTDGEQTILFEILDRRYSEMRPSILITNQDKAGFKSYVGDRVFDRLGETCSWVSFDWPSYRPLARKAEA